jgi:nucleotide-binding universal stress UspA family protein
VKEPVAALDRILVAVDGSEEADKAVEFLARRPFKGAPGLTVVTVWPQARASVMPSLKRAGRAEVRDVVKSKGEELLHALADRLGKEVYKVETELLQGDPAFMILDAAIRHEAQMILLGSRGIKAIRRFLLGSVCQKVLVHALCSVMIVR